ncbi:MAG: flavodoxin family protein, partial [Pseudomonadota bacterium]
RIGVFTTCGATWAVTRFVGSPGRRTLLRGFRLLCARGARTVFCAHYAMDRSTAASRARHLQRVARAMDRLIEWRERA